MGEQGIWLMQRPQPGGQRIRPPLLRPLLSCCWCAFGVTASRMIKRGLRVVARRAVCQRWGEPASAWEHNECHAEEHEGEHRPLEADHLLSPESFPNPCPEPLHDPVIIIQADRLPNRPSCEVERWQCSGMDVLLVT